MKNKWISIAVLLLSVLSFLGFSDGKSAKTIETGKTRYNLCCFICFADEEDEINQFEYGVPRKQIIDNTYNGSIYSYREYFRSVSNGNIDIQTVYLFPEAEGFSSFRLEKSRNTYAKKSDENPDGYESETMANTLLQIDWSSKIQKALDQGILPCTIDDRENTIPLSLLDGDENGEIDSITLIFAPQKSNHYSVTWGEPLYPCKSRCGRITITVGDKTVTSGDYNQWVGDYSTVYKESETSNTFFLTNGVGIHEMGHMFGFLDLYDYNQMKFPVGNMSIMSNTLTPVPQFMTSYEREIQGWLTRTNIKQISKSGIYELDPVTDCNSGVVCYKMPLEGFENKWLYLEYRVFDDASVNRFDSKNRGLYLASGTKLNEIAGKSGVVVYIVDVSNKFPTNYSGNPKYFGIDVLGGTNKNRTDAPRTVGDIVNISTYNRDGAYLSTGCRIEIIGFENGKAQVQVTAPFFSEQPEISAETIGNRDLYDKLCSFSPSDALYDVSLDQYEYLDLSFMKIQNIDFLSYFHLKNLKYIVLAGNRISNVDGLPAFIEQHPDVRILLDNNRIDLEKIDPKLLNLKNVLYGIQNIDAEKGGTVRYTKPLSYHINESFPISEYSIMYNYENGMSTKQLKRGLSCLELTESGMYDFDCIYFFDEKNNVKYSYRYSVEVVPTVRNHFELSSDTLCMEINRLFSLPIVSNGEDANDYRICIYMNGKSVDKTVSDSFRLNEVGKHVIRIEFVRLADNETYTLSLEVNVVDTVEPSLSLIGDSNYSTVKDFTDPGISIADNSLTESFVMSKSGTQNGFSLKIDMQYSENKEENRIISVLYTYEYWVTDPSGNTASITRSVEVYNEEYLVKSDCNGFTVHQTILDANGHEILTITVNGEYRFWYSITDKYGKTVDFCVTVVVTNLKPEDTGTDSGKENITDASPSDTETGIPTKEVSTDDRNEDTVPSESDRNPEPSLPSKGLVIGIIIVMVAVVAVIPIIIKKLR